MASGGVLVGIDLGGTNIKAGLVTREGEVLRRARCETLADEGPDAVLGRMAGLAEELLEAEGAASSEIIGVGVGSPGPLNTKTGVVVYTPNLPGWTDIHVSETLKARLSADVYLEGDANAAAWGEFWRGAGRDVQSMVIFTLGTGVGGGIIIDGKLIRGIDDTGGHLGHIVIDPEGRVCPCGNAGCLEAYASATAVVRRYHEMIDAGRGCELAAQLDGAVTAKDIHEHALAGCGDCRWLIDETGRHLGVALTTVANMINPELAVYSGGMSAAGELLFGPILEEVRRRALKPCGKRIKVVAAELGDDAGVIGAAGCALVRSGQG